MPYRIACHAAVARLAIAVSLLSVVARAASAQSTTAADPPPTHTVSAERRAEGWQGAVIDSLRLLLIEHTTRIIFHPKTRAELGGPFLHDYFRSVKRPLTWSDGDDWLVNYVGHPIHGAAAGYLWIDNAANSPPPAEGFGRRYWASRARATAWSAIYSLQFEFGPLSEASIGNVGMYRYQTGWTDHVVTPLGGLALIVAEDLAEQHLLKWLEPRVGSPNLRKILRVAITPSRSFANMAQGRMPWFRPAPPR